jgi:hypothetical protein
LTLTPRLKSNEYAALRGVSRSEYRTRSIFESRHEKDERGQISAIGFVRFWTNDVCWPVKSVRSAVKWFGFFGQRSAFFGQPFMDLCFGIEIRASDEFDGLDTTKNLQSL